MLRLYDYLDSGNGYKVRLLLAQLGLAYELAERDIMRGETRTPEFLAMNPNGRVPLLELAPGRYLPESGAILWYLAEGTRFVPGTREGRAAALAWMFFEQYSHEPFIATSRFWRRHFELDDERRRALAGKRAGGEAALAIMEGHIAAHDWFAGGRYSIADIALYGYTHVADEGGFDLAPYPAIRRWLDRVRGQPGHVPMLSA